MDGGSQVRHVPALAVGTATWLRDEEAAGSNPATPTLKPQVTHHKAACGSFSPLPMSYFGSERKPILQLTSLTRYSGPGDVKEIEPARAIVGSQWGRRRGRPHRQSVALAVRGSAR